MNVFPAASRARAIGIWSGVVGLAIAAGPIVGGALLQQFWWGSVFLVNVPLAIIAVILMIIYIPESKNPKPGRYDLGGVLLSIAGLVILVYGIIKGGEYANFSKPEAWGCILGGIVLIAAWVVNEHRSTHPEFDVRYFRNRRFSASITAIAVMAFGLNGVVFFYVFYTQSIRGYSPLQSGLILLALAAAQMFFAPRARHTVARFGPRLTCAGALAVMAISFLGFLLLGQSTPIWVLVVLLFIMGIGTAHVLPPATVMVMAALPQEKAGSGSAINNAFRQVGAAVGVAVLGSLLSYVYRRDVDGHLTALPAGTRSIADQSIEATISIVHSPPVVRAAESAFINAMHITAIAAAIVAFLGSAVALAFLPPKPRTEQRSQDAANAEPVKAK